MSSPYEIVKSLLQTEKSSMMQSDNKYLFWVDKSANKIEIKQAIDSGKLKLEDVNKAKRNCPVDITFFWESIQGNLPRTRSFKFDIS